MIALLGFLMLEGQIRPKEPIVRTFRTLRRAMAPETDIRIEYLGWDKPRLAQLARAPDCRLETLGCGQPSGGPRFKSGSADQHVTYGSARYEPFMIECKNEMNLRSIFILTIIKILSDQDS